MRTWSIGSRCATVLFTIVTLCLGGGACSGPAKRWSQADGQRARSLAFSKCAENFRLDRKYCIDHFSTKASPEDEHIWAPCMDGATRSFSNCIDAIE